MDYPEGFSDRRDQQSSSEVNRYASSAGEQDSEGDRTLTMGGLHTSSSDRHRDPSQHSTRLRYSPQLSGQYDAHSSARSTSDYYASSEAGTVSPNPSTAHSAHSPALSTDRDYFGRESLETNDSRRGSSASSNSKVPTKSVGKKKSWHSLPRFIKSSAASVTAPIPGLRRESKSDATTNGDAQDTTMPADRPQQLPSLESRASFAPSLSSTVANATPPRPRRPSLSPSSTSRPSTDLNDTRTEGLPFASGRPSPQPAPDYKRPQLTSTKSGSGSLRNNRLQPLVTEALHQEGGTRSVSSPTAFGGSRTVDSPTSALLASTTSGMEQQQQSPFSMATPPLFRRFPESANSPYRSPLYSPTKRGGTVSSSELSSPVKGSSTTKLASGIQRSESGLTSSSSTSSSLNAFLLNNGLAGDDGRKLDRQDSRSSTVEDLDTLLESIDAIHQSLGLEKDE